MALPKIRSFWLSLVLVLSCLGSAPLGSMEQSPAGAPTQAAAVRAMHAPTPVGLRSADAWLKQKADAPAPDPVELAPPPLASAPPFLFVGIPMTGAGLRRLSHLLPPRTCEALPYHANAPPAVA